MSTGETIAAFIAAFAIVFGIIMIISIGFAVVHCIAMWKLYEKAGEPGWSAIVPVYNMMQQIKIATGDFRLAWIYLALYGGYFVINTLSSFFTTFASDSDAAAIATMVVSVLMMLISIPLAVLDGYTSYMFAKSYGKSQTFCILSIFFGGITVLIMGFDKSTQYVGPKGEPQYGGYGDYNNYNKYY